MKINTKKWLNFLFVAYCLFMLWVTLFSRKPSTHRFELSIFWSFRELFSGHPDGVKDIVQYLDNILFFIPFGFLLPCKKNSKQVAHIAFAASVVIELSQYVFALGLAETDDVISNVLGGLIGFCLYRLTKKYEEEKLMNRKQGIYEKYIKRIFDIICALLAIVVFCWLYAIIAVLVRIKLGSPVLFKQPRPGKDEKIFNLYKFRTMTDERDENGNLLPDDVRLGKFGKALRATSLDELPEAFNILKGDMSIIGDSEIIGTTEKNLDFTRVWAA